MNRGKFVEVNAGDGTYHVDLSPRAEIVGVHFLDDATRYRRAIEMPATWRRTPVRR